MTNFFIIIAILIIIHAIYNLINFLRYNSIYKNFFGMFCDNITIRDKCLSQKNTVINYIKLAGVSDKKIPYSQPLGYGYIVSGKTSVLENITNSRQDIVSASYELLLEAKGNYWSRFINSINPFYWLRIIFFIPKYLLSYLGVPTDSIIIKILQILYWLIGIIFTFLISVYPNEIQDFINSIFHIN